MLASHSGMPVSAAIRLCPSESRCSHCGVRARRVRGRHRRDSFVERHAGVDDDEGIAEPLERLQLLVRLLGEHQDGAVSRPVHQPVEERDLAVVEMQGRREHDCHVLLVERLGRTGEDVREVGRLDDRERDADQAGAAAGEGARAPVRGEALVAHDAQDRLARCRRHVGMVVEDAGDRGDRDAGGARHLPDRRARLDSSFLR